MKITERLTKFVWIFGTLTWLCTAFVIFEFGGNHMLLVKKIYLLIFYPITLYIGILVDKARKIEPF